MTGSFSDQCWKDERTNCARGFRHRRFSAHSIEVEVELLLQVTGPWRPSGMLCLKMNAMPARVITKTSVMPRPRPVTPTPFEVQTWPAKLGSHRQKIEIMASDRR